MKNLLLATVILLGMNLTTMAQNVPSYVPTNGLLGWWPFNGNANDESGNGLNGTVNFATLTTDRNNITNSAYEFNGNSSISCLNASGIPNEVFSVSVWVYQVEAFLSKEFICLGSPSSTSWGTVCSDNYITLGYGAGCSGSQTPSFFDNTSIELSTWYNLIYVNYGADLNSEIYLNGVLIGTQTQSNSGSCASENLYFGVDIFSFPEYINGKLDDIGIWNRALTQQEIFGLYTGCQLLINNHPSNQTVNSNNSAQFIVSSSDPNSTYQWQTDLGVGFQNLSSVGQYSGTNSDTLIVSNVTTINNNQNFRCVISSGSCTDTSIVAILTVSNNVGFSNIFRDDLFSIFPNPAHSQLNITVNPRYIGASYLILDYTGKIILNGKITTENSIVDVSNLSSGFYVLSIDEKLNQSFGIVKNQ